MAEAIVGSMLGKLQQLAVKEARTLAAVEEDTRKLRDKLMWMQAFLRDVEPSRRVEPNELIKVWLQQTRDAVFDAEDAVDQFFIRIDLSRFPSWSRAFLSFFASFTTQVAVRHDLSKRIRLINTRLEEIISNKDRYRVGESTTLGSTWRPSTSTSPLSEKMHDVVLPLVGREALMDKLKSSLFGSSGHQRVITVTGESGVGKTKLVKDLYEMRHTLSSFDIHDWVSFGLNLSASDILKLIIARIKDGEACRKDKIKERLAQILEGKKYLFVIDGEISSSEWNRIFSVLPKDVNPGSRLVRITQRKPEKPPQPYEESEIEVERFTDEESIIQLFEKTFLMKDRNLLAEKEAIQDYKEKIIKSTKGLPLAVVLLSGLLRTKEYPQEWKAVFDHLEKIRSKQVDRILSLCFDDLHYDLKSCFLYFAALPVNNLIRAQNMVCMWMAEGFLTPKARTMEKLGEQYMKELIDRRLVNLAPVGYAVPGDERVTVQSKVHAFLQHEAQEESFVEIHCVDDAPALTNVRRLSLQNHRDKFAALSRPLPKLRAILSNFETEEEAEKIHDVAPGEAGGEGDRKKDGLLPARHCPNCSRPWAREKKKAETCVQQLLRNSKFLRVVHFNGLEIDRKLPSEVGSVAHLQYLRITSCSLEEIPQSIGKLSSLQTIDVRHTNVRRLPATFWSIKTLRHVLGDFLFLPKRVARLRKLQTLSSVKPEDGVVDGWDGRTFNWMPRLWSLHIHHSDSLSSHNRVALVNAAAMLKYLVVLTIKARTIPSEVFTKSKLERLKAMELVGELEPALEQEDIAKMEIRARLPNLVKLQLKETMVSQKFIDKLGDLQFLSALALRRGSYKDRKLVFVRGFRSLKELMVHAKELDWMEIQERALPELKDLIIVSYSSNFYVEIYGHSKFVQDIKPEDGLYKIIAQQDHVEDKKIRMPED